MNRLEKIAEAWAGRPTDWYNWADALERAQRDIHDLVAAVDAFRALLPLAEGYVSWEQDMGLDYHPDMYALSAAKLALAPLLRDAPESA